jgi:hypothetical protein
VRTSPGSEHRRMHPCKENGCGSGGFPLNVREARLMPGLRTDQPINPETGLSQRDAISVSISGQRFDLELDGCQGVSCG